MEMSLELIKELVDSSGDEKYISAFGAVEQTYKSNLDRLTVLEKDLNKAIQKRDETKNLVKSVFGVDEISEENLRNIIKDKKDDAEYKNLLTIAEQNKTQAEQLRNELIQTKNMYMIESQLNSLGVSSDVEGKKAYKILVDEILSGAQFTESGVKFVTPEGVTMRNVDGSEVTLEDRYNQLKESEDLGFIFKAKRAKSGSGAQATSVNSQQVTSINQLDEQQRIALFKQNPELFRKLSNQ
jgi:hypothetical protein